MAKQFLRPQEVESAQRDKAAIEASIKARKVYNINLPEDAEAAGNLRAALTAVNKRLALQPPDLTPEQRSAVKKEIGELEEKMKVGMLSAEEMRRNPSGAEPRNTAWERRNKSRVLRWKNLLLALHKGMPHSEMQHKLNIARLRPRTSMLNMDSAQIQRERSFVSGFGDQVDWAADADSPQEPAFPELQDEKLEEPQAPTIEELLAGDEDDPEGLERTLAKSFGADARE